MDTESTNTPSAARTISRGAKVVSVAFVGAALGVGAALVASASGGASDSKPPAVGDAPAHSLVQTESIAEWGRANGLTGLSPASLQRAPAEPIISSAYAGMDAFAQWALANGLTGLSPASLQRAPNRSAEAVAEARLDELAEWALANGLTGLSPASLQRAPAQP